MVIYTKLNLKHISMFEKHFNLDTIKEFQPLTGGSTNSSYLLISETEKYILTVCDDKNREQIQSLMELLEHLEAHDFQTSKAFKSVNGEYVLEFDNKPVYLKSYLEGIVPRKLSSSSLETLGKEIAKLHKIKVLDSIPDSFTYGLKYFREVTTSSYSHPYKNWLIQKCNYLESHIPNNLPLGLVHGDIFLDNLVDDENGKIFILDFEEASLSPFIFDIGMALTGVCSDKNEISLRSAKSLIKGYQKVRELNQIEKNCIKLFTIYASTATSFWRFRQYHLKIPTPKKFDKYQQMAKIADSLLIIDNKNFMKQIGLY